MKILGMSLVWILLLGSLITPMGLSAFATTGTSTMVTSSHNPSTFGQIVTFTASVTPHTATGTVQFNDTSTNPPTTLGTGTLNNTGIATFGTSSLSIGSHNIVAKYIGNVNNTASTSGILVQVVNSVLTSSVITLNANTTSIILGHTINFTAMVSPNAATGSVQFLINGTNFGSPITLSGGKSSIVISSLPIGTNIVIASYSGSSTFSPSSSNSVTVKVATTVQSGTQGKVTGGGHIGKNINFGFNVDADSHGKNKIKGNIQYNDKTSKIKMHSNNVTSLSIASDLMHASFDGNAIVNDTSGFAFSVNITDPDKTGKHDVFSITITDGSGNIVYKNSGQVKGHIEIHAVHNDNSQHVKQVHEKNSHAEKSTETGKYNSQGKDKHKSKNHQD